MAYGNIQPHLHNAGLWSLIFAAAIARSDEWNIVNSIGKSIGSVWVCCFFFSGSDSQCSMEHGKFHLVPWQANTYFHANWNIFQFMSNAYSKSCQPRDEPVQWCWKLVLGILCVLVCLCGSRCLSSCEWNKFLIQNRTIFIGFVSNQLQVTFYS